MPARHRPSSINLVQLAVNPWSSLCLGLVGVRQTLLPTQHSVARRHMSAWPTKPAQQQIKRRKLQQDVSQQQQQQHEDILDDHTHAHQQDGKPWQWTTLSGFSQQVAPLPSSSSSGADLPEGNNGQTAATPGDEPTSPTTGNGQPHDRACAFSRPDVGLTGTLLLLLPMPSTGLLQDVKQSPAKGAYCALADWTSSIDRFLSVPYSVTVNGYSHADVNSW